MSVEKKYTLEYTPVVLNRLMDAFSEIDIKDIPSSENSDDAIEIAYVLLAKLGKNDELLNEVFQNITGESDDFAGMSVPFLVGLFESFFLGCGNSLIKYIKRLVTEKKKQSKTELIEALQSQMKEAFEPLVKASSELLINK